MRLTLEEKVARNAAREAERIAQIKWGPEDAALCRTTAKMFQARSQLEAWFPHKLDTVRLAIGGDNQAIMDLVQDGNYWGDPMVAWALGMLLPTGNEGMRNAVRLLWSGHRRSALENLPTNHAKDLLRRYGTKPVNYPKTITVYRGGFNSAPINIACGWSWTTDLLEAAFFVDYQRLFAERKDKQPYLLRATVKTSQIVHVDDERGEAEKVIFGVRDFEVYGTPEDWVRWSEQRESRRKQVYFNTADDEAKSWSASRHSSPERLEQQRADHDLDQDNLPEYAAQAAVYGCRLAQWHGPPPVSSQIARIAAKPDTYHMMP